MPKTEPKFSIIVKTYNSGKTIISTLESVCSFGEIIAIDCHSSDDTIDILNEYKVKTIFSDKADVETAYIQAIEETKGDWILLLEDDEIIPNILLDELTKYTQNPKKNKYVISFIIKTFYLNKEIKSAKQKNIVRFFKKGHCLFDEKTKELKPKESKIHKLKVKNCYILKYLQNDISNFLVKITDENKNTLRHIKRKKCSVFIYPIIKFMSFYLFRLGIFDGIGGFINAKKEAIKAFILEVMILEKKFKEKE